MQTKNSKNDENRLDIQKFKLIMMPLLWFWSDNDAFGKIVLRFYSVIARVAVYILRSGQGNSYGCVF